MAIRLKEITITLTEASGASPHMSKRNTYTHYVLELDGPTLIKRGAFTYNIIALDWNDAGTSQLLVADNGQKFRLGDIEVIKETPIYASPLQSELIEIMASREYERLP